MFSGASIEGSVSIGGVTIRQSVTRGRRFKVVVLLDGQATEQEFAVVDGSPPTVTVHGGPDRVETGGNVIVTGNVTHKVQTASGDIDIEAGVAHNVRTSSGDVTVGLGVAGRVDTSSGNVTTNAAVKKVQTTSGHVRVRNGSLQRAITTSGNISSH